MSVQPEKCNLIKIVFFTVKHTQDKNYVGLKTAIFCVDCNRALFQYKAKQPKEFQEIRVDSLFIK